MIWGFPAAFGFAAIMLPVLAIFFYRRRSQRIEVPAVQFWIDLGRPTEVQSFAALLRRLLSLLIQLVLVGLLVLALADPWPKRPTARRTVLVVDLSATMQSKEANGISRFELARQRLLEMLDGVAPDSEVAILAASGSPQLVVAPTRNLAVVSQQIHQLAPLDVDGDLPSAITLAAAFVDSPGLSRVLVVSDFAAEDPQVLRDGWRGVATLSLYPVGHDQPNAGIVDCWCEPAERGWKVEAKVGAQGFDGQPAKVALSVAGQVVEAKTIALASVPTPVVFTVAAPAGAAFEVSLDVPDALAVDNRAFGVFPRRQRRTVLLVTPGNRVLESALRANDRVDLRVMPLAAYHGPEDASVVVADRVMLPGDIGPGAAHYLFIGTADPFGWCRALQWQMVLPVTHWSGDDRIMTDVDPTTLRIPRALALDPSPGAFVDEIMDAGPVPLVLALETEQSRRDVPNRRQAVYWLFDLLTSDVPRHLSFPVLLANTLESLGPSAGEETAASQRPGRPLHLGLASSSHPPQVLSPDGRAITVRGYGGDWIALDTDRQGVYEIKSAEGSRLRAVSLLSSRTVRPLPARTLTEDSLPTGAAAASALPFIGDSSLVRIPWRALLLGATVLALLEWLLFHRRLVRIG